MRKEIHTIYDSMKEGKITREIYKKTLRRYKYKCLKEQKRTKEEFKKLSKTEQKWQNMSNTWETTQALK